MTHSSPPLPIGDFLLLVVVHQFGEGGFLRGFADWMIQKMTDVGAFEGKVVVVQPIEQGMCDMLTKQNCVYTHVIRGVEGVDTTVVDVISRCVKPYEDFNAYIALAENPDFRFVVSKPPCVSFFFPEKHAVILELFSSVRASIPIVLDIFSTDLR